jgi:MFS family permease
MVSWAELAASISRSSTAASPSPVGWLADKTSRSKILAFACAIWSAATMCCGFAGNYLQFAIGYMTVGFGEAGGVPPSYSIICDYFPPGRRGRALGLYNVGPADRRSAGHRLRRFHRCGIQLALCVHLAGRCGSYRSDRHPLPGA